MNGDEWKALNRGAHATLHALQPTRIMMRGMMMITMMMRRRRMMTRWGWGWWGWNQTCSLLFPLWVSFISIHVNLKLRIFLIAFYRTDVGGGGGWELGNFGIMKTVTSRIMGGEHFSSFIFRPSAPNVPLNLLWIPPPTRCYEDTWIHCSCSSFTIHLTLWKYANSRRIIW